MIGPDVAKIIQERTVLTYKQYQKLQAEGLNSFERTVLVPYMDLETLNHFIDSILKNSEHKLDVTFINPPRTYDDCAIGVIIPELRRRLAHVVNVLQKYSKQHGTKDHG